MGHKITIKKFEYGILISITVVSLKNDTHAICYVAKLRLVDYGGAGLGLRHSTVAAAFTGTVGAFVPRPFWSCLPSTLLSLLPVRRATNLRPQSINSRKIEKKATEYLSAFFSFLSLNFDHTTTTKKSSTLSYASPLLMLLVTRIRILL